MNLLDISLSVASLGLMMLAWRLVGCVKLIVLKQHEQGQTTFAINILERMPSLTPVQVVGEVLIHASFLFMALKLGLIYFGLMTIAGLALNIAVMFVRKDLEQKLGVVKNKVINNTSNQAGSVQLAARSSG